MNRFLTFLNQIEIDLEIRVYPTIIACHSFNSRLSLFYNSLPTFTKFGLHFLWYVEWDIINEEFGAAISIVGTLLSAGIAMLISVPLAFGIAFYQKVEVFLQFGHLQIQGYSIEVERQFGHLAQVVFMCGFRLAINDQLVHKLFTHCTKAHNLVEGILIYIVFLLM